MSMLTGTVAEAEGLGRGARDPMMDRSRPWTEQEGLGSAGSSVAAPPPE